MTRKFRVERGARRGFTLVELLAVIAIIVLLIGILVPAVSAVRTQARVTATKGVMATLETGAQAFNADGRVGGGYPPSAPDTASYDVKNPYKNQGISGDKFKIQGASLLVWALAGADLLGTPGFKIFRTGTAKFWGDDTDADGTAPASAGAYALESNTARPIYPRSGPYVDLAKIKVARLNKSLGIFEIPAETEAREARGATTKPDHREAPMFLDAFGFPILYYRADPAGVTVADTKATDKLDERGIYHWRDNGFLVGGQRNNDDRLILSAGGDGYHDLQFDESGRRPSTGGGGGNPFGFKPGTFRYFIFNKNVTAAPRPHNPDSYLLISAGPDATYGTADDIANFEHNGLK